MADVYPGWYAGYFEISYFKTNYFNQVASPQNVQAFSTVNLYTSTSAPGTNFENLFLTYDIYSQDPPSEPPANSLFNIATFQQLI